MTTCPSDLADFRFGFRVLGDCRQPRLLIDWQRAFNAYAQLDQRCELERESYLSAFCFAADFRAHLAATSSTANYNGPSWTPWLPLDVDREGDLPAALEDARRLTVLLTGELRIREDDLLVFFSGSKGFHLLLPAACWTPQPGLHFHRVARNLAAALADRANATIDAGIYDRVRCFRAPNSRHPKTGLHKRRLSTDELLHLAADRIVETAKRPAEFEIPEPTYRSEPLAALWHDAEATVQRDVADRAARLATGGVPQQLNRSTIDFIANGASKGDRHRLLYSAAANLAELGAPLRLCIALLEPAALDCGLPPKDVHRAIENGWASMQPGIREAAAALHAEVVAVRRDDASAVAGKGGGS